GDYPQALEYYQQSLAITRDIGEAFGTSEALRATEGKTLNNIGAVYHSLGDYPQALEYFQQSLAITREIGDRAAEGRTLSNIGIVYYSLGNYPQALDFYQQSLAIIRDIGDRAGEGTILGNIGVVYRNLGDYPQALEYFQQALAITREIGDRAGEANTLSNMGRLFDDQADPALAIIFLKQAINTYETIRERNQALAQNLQDTYTATIEDNYRQLADLLLQQDRILEAQRVLDLLKVQELDNYVRGVRSTRDTQAGIVLRPDEQAIVDRYHANEENLIELGRERATLAQIPLDQRNPTQTERIAELRRLEQSVLYVFHSFFEQPEIVGLVDRLRRTEGAANLELAELNALRDNLKALKETHNQTAVVLYPLVLEDRLELVLVTADTAPVRRTVAVPRTELNRAIGQLRYALESPDRNAEAPAQQLYDWLIRPIATDLAQAQADTIIYAPDLRLRYIPLAALHDGEQWLIQTYRVNNITAASLTELDNAPDPGSVNVLAAAFTEGRHEVQVGDRTLAYTGLPFAGPEIDTLSSLIPNTVQRLNDDFNPGIIIEMDDYRIIHLATHAEFNPGPPENSYILFGNGDQATLADVKRLWSFPNVELVVLSACETAVGDVLRDEADTAAGDGASITGEEILGFGYLMQQAGADAAIGSLWQVDDGGTQILMSAFYDALSRGGLSKVESLQQAQLDLIRRGEAGDRGGFELANSEIAANTLAHPYYWAPFILIGNGL
ncbi:MAG: CHAT domain-containing protein, partial [Pseudanabaenales cyanobacterium]|nr:CHAT domain-containing protein [Pseudanabaenales cyanobacterium]